MGKPTGGNPGERHLAETNEKRDVKQMSMIHKKNDFRQAIPPEP